MQKPTPEHDYTTVKAVKGKLQLTRVCLLKVKHFTAFDDVIAITLTKVQ